MSLGVAIRSVLNIILYTQKNTKTVTKKYLGRNTQRPSHSANHNHPTTTISNHIKYTRLLQHKKSLTINSRSLKNTFHQPFRYQRLNHAVLLPISRARTKSWVKIKKCARRAKKRRSSRHRKTIARPAERGCIIRYHIKLPAGSRASLTTIFLLYKMPCTAHEEGVKMSHIACAMTIEIRVRQSSVSSRARAVRARTILQRVNGN